jgi:hypothetical protein
MFANSRLDRRLLSVNTSVARWVGLMRGRCGVVAAAFWSTYPAETTLSYPMTPNHLRGSATVSLHTGRVRDPVARIS